MVLLISIIGILGATAAPRFLDSSTQDALFHHRETLHAMRYARKLAVASHCPVEFDFTATGYRLMQRASCDSGAYSQAVFDPASGALGYTGTAPSGLTITSSLDPVYFDELGRSTNASGTPTDVSISIGGNAIAALGESGYIYAP